MNENISARLISKAVLDANDFRNDQENNTRWAARIACYWRERGFANVSAIPIITTQLVTDKDGQTERRMAWTVKTNLINGLPPKMDVKTTYERVHHVMAG